MSTPLTALPLRFMCLALAAGALLVALPVRDAQACACCGTYRVINVEDWDVLNVRSGPGTGYRIVHALAPDEGCIELTGRRRGSWLHIESQGLTGWVNGRYLGYIR
jgi:uncharacterized protein YraI